MVPSRLDRVNILVDRDSLINSRQESWSLVRLKVIARYNQAHSYGRKVEEMMQTITLEIKDPKTMKELEETARQRGKRPEDFILELLEAELLADKPFEEIVAPLEESFDESGMAEEEFDDLIEKERQAIWDEKYGVK